MTLNKNKRHILAGEIYHVLNRGVDKRSIFLDDNDRFRFIHDLFEFNDANQINNVFYRFNKPNVIARHYIEPKPRRLIVEILAFVMMPNHYHLLLRPLINNGITMFMKRLGMGYARYFNEKYKRSGALFQGRYKAVHVIKDSHFLHLPYYIHFNPLDLTASEWRKRKLGNPDAAIKFLDNYRWSSHLDYLGKKNFPSVTQRDFLLKFFNGHDSYKKSILNWLKDLNTDTIGC